MSDEVSVSSIGASIGEGSRLSVPLIDRQSYLIALASRAERVAHIGCTDVPFTVERLAKRELLHEELIRVSVCDGFDVDETSLGVLQDRFRDESFILTDVASSAPADLVGHYDLAIAGEVLEHVPNAGDFVSGCSKLVKPGGMLCFSVPNALSPKGGLRAVLGTELVHPDHRAYYSPRTLSRLVSDHDLRIVEFGTYFARASLTARFANTLLKVGHSLRAGPTGDGLVVLAEKPF